MTPVAHIGGLPVEESLLTLAPVLPLLALAARDKLARARGRLRPGQSDGKTPEPPATDDRAPAPDSRCRVDAPRPAPALSYSNATATLRRVGRGCRHRRPWALHKIRTPDEPPFNPGCGHHTVNPELPPGTATKPRPQERR